jgi:2-polyprenyl-3-methyl-5-hydroxy-6-metoxy-1,4-benzoquinol methylase
MRAKNLIDKSYEAQEADIAKIVPNKEQNLFHIKNKDCAAYRLTAEPLENLTPFLDAQKSWLTVADYNGFEANFLMEKGQNVVASDISDAMLKEANADGLIGEYRKENVEALTFEDESFDYVMCKEAFHHFPRAYLALYEMIRVSRSAAILVGEPIDILSKMSLLVFVKNILDAINPRLIDRFWKNRFSFETVGNYVFKISVREVEKIAMGIGLPCIAYRKFNIYLSNGPTEGLWDVPLNTTVYKKIQSRMAVLNFFNGLGLFPHHMICCVLFKEPPTASVLDRMKQQGFQILQLPRNPYLH